jgi:hypothetical protein
MNDMHTSLISETPPCGGVSFAIDESAYSDAASYRAVPIIHPTPNEAASAAKAAAPSADVVAKAAPVSPCDIPTDSPTPPPTAAAIEMPSVAETPPEISSVSFKVKVFIHTLLRDCRLKEIRVYEYESDQGPKDAAMIDSHV